MSKNHTQPSVKDTVTGFDTSDYPQHLKRDIRLHRPLPQEVVVYFVVRQGDHPPLDPK